MFQFDVQFSAADINKAGKIRRTTKKFTVYAVDAHRAIDEARKQVQSNPKLAALFYPAYRITGTKD